jgi:hypothetical protein
MIRDPGGAPDASWIAVSMTLETGRGTLPARFVVCAGTRRKSSSRLEICPARFVARISTRAACV